MDDPYSIFAQMKKAWHNVRAYTNAESDNWDQNKTRERNSIKIVSKVDKDYSLEILKNIRQTSKFKTTGSSKYVPI